MLNTLPYVLDSCQVNNGGCGCQAGCSHDSKTNAVVCVCKTGYTNTATGSGAVCTGKKKWNRLKVINMLFCDVL